MQTLLKILEDGRFHSGEEMGAALGIGRSAVWKKLKQLEQELSIPLQKVRGKGYRLAGSITPLHLGQLDSPWPLELLSVVDSTNAEAMRRLRHTPAPFAIIAEQQTAGRGRRGRKWISPYGENLYYSLAITVTEGATFLEGLSLIISLAVVKTLQVYDFPVSLGVKWPNDVLLDGKKIGGILLELSGDPADICHVVIGIGINVNMCSASEIGQPWTSLREVLRQILDRSILIKKLTEALAFYIDRHRQQGFAASKSEWESVHLWQNALVELSSGEHVIMGKALGIDDKGALRLEVEGQERSFSGGELSLRLKYDS